MRTRSNEYRAIMTAVAGVSALAAMSAVVPVVEHVVGAALVAAGLAWASVAAVRREIRIRRRLADTAGSPDQRVGPGDPPPALPAPSSDSFEHTGGVV